MTVATVKVAVAGLGFMGGTHVRAWQKIPGARLAAVVSSDARKLAGGLTPVRGNLDVEAGPLDLSEARKYRTLDEALSDDTIDAVDICLPTDRHAPAALAALEAGKHVLIEKPMALDAADCERILRAAEKNGRIVMTGHVLRFLPAYAALRDLIAGSGAVRSATFRRRCAAPDWSPWLTDPRRSGGGVFDLLIHDVDFCRALWGMPEMIRAAGHENLEEGIDVIVSELRYPNAGPVIVTGGWHHRGAYPFSMEFTVVTDGATLEWRSGETALRVYRGDGIFEERTLDSTDPFTAELSYFAECVRAGVPPRLCPPVESAQAVALMRQILESRARGGESVKCD